MKTSHLISVVAAAAALTAGNASAADVPFPSPTVTDVTVSSQNVTTGGAVTNLFVPGDTVVFRTRAVDNKTKTVLAGKDVKFFYVTIPGQANVKLSYAPGAPGASPRFPWVGVWRVPATHPLGLVNFRILIKTDSKRKGQYVQIPVASSQLTIVHHVDPTFRSSTVTDAVRVTGSPDIALYVDAVNGTRPVGAAPRAIGCTQSNVFKRGEQFVIRAWGSDVTNGAILSMDNVSEAYFTAPGQARVTLPWGAHGAASNRVWFWANAWNIPTDYPLGEVTVRVVFTLDSGKTGVFDYRVTIIP